MVSCPLLTPLTFLRDATPFGCASKCEGPTDIFGAPQGFRLIEAEPVAATGQPLCTGWPRTVMRGKSRKVNSGHNSHISAARRPEPSPRNPRLAANASLSGLKGKFGELRGERKPFGCLSPLAPVGGHRHPRPPKAAISPRPGMGPISPPAAHRCIGGTAYPLLRAKRKGALRLRRQAVGTAERSAICFR